MKDNNIYVNTYFRIRCNKDNFDNGMTEEDVKNYFTEVTQILTKLGYKFEDINKLMSGHCPTGYKDFGDLYCHPNMISGYVNKDCINDIEAALKEAKTFKYEYTDLYKEIRNYTNEEFLNELNNCKEKIENNILQIFKTKRRNLFVHESAIYNIKSGLNYDDNWKLGLKQLETNYIMDVFSRLIDNGKLQFSKIKSGNGYRSVA
jgi:hypothetical protein